MEKKFTLQNGLRLISDQNKNVNSVSISIFFRVGSAYENRYNYGITHLVEHLFFRRFNDLSNLELYYRTESIGTELRGRTFRDFVCFEAVVVPQYFKSLIDLIINLFADFSWSQDDLDAEKAVVKKQIDFSTQSYMDLGEELYFNQEKYRVPIMGDWDIVKNLSLVEVNQWKQKYFQCSNTAVAIVGGFSQNDLEYATKCLSALKCISDEPIQKKWITPKNLFCRSEKDIRLLPTNSSISDVWIMFDVNLNSCNLTTVEMLSTILGGWCGSRLPYLLIDTYALTDMISSVVYQYADFARISIEYSVFGRDVLESLSYVFDTVKALKKDIRREDFDKMISFFTANRIKDYDDPQGLSFTRGYDEWIQNYTDEPVLKDISYIKISDTILKAAQFVFSPENLSIFIQNNRKEVKQKNIKNLCINFRETLKDSYNTENNQGTVL